jgi:hypothetical protein
MNIQGHAKKNLKLSETDKRVLLASMNAADKQLPETKVEAEYNNKTIKFQ